MLFIICYFNLHCALFFCQFSYNLTPFLFYDIVTFYTYTSQLLEVILETRQCFKVRHMFIHTMKKSSHIYLTKQIGKQHKPKKTKNGYLEVVVQV